MHGYSWRMILCNLSSEVGNCSDLFDGIGVPITVVQAFFAAIVIAVSVPMNLLLITAMILYRHCLDETVPLVVSCLISNTILTQCWSTHHICSASLDFWLCWLSSLCLNCSHWSSVTMDNCCRTPSCVQVFKVFFPLCRSTKKTHPCACCVAVGVCCHFLVQWNTLVEAHSLIYLTLAACLQLLTPSLTLDMVLCWSCCIWLPVLYIWELYNRFCYYVL